MILSAHSVLKNIEWHTLINRKDGVLGIAFVKKGYIANLHRHFPDETYMFVHGYGDLNINGAHSYPFSPHVVQIPGNVLHSMTPKSSYVVLLYMFKTGPFESIVYEFNNE